SYLAVSQGVKMFESGVCSEFVIDHDRTDGIVAQFASDHCSGDAALFEIGQNVNIDEQPVCKNNQRLDTPVQQHLQIALKAAPLIVHISENGKIRRLIESI